MPSSAEMRSPVYGPNGEEAGAVFNAVRKDGSGQDKIMIGWFGGKR